MSGNMSVDHLDEFTLLRYAVADLDGGEREAAEDHLHACARCAASLSAMEKLDEQLRTITRDFTVDDGLPAGDPFARRPEAPPRRAAAAPALEGESLAIVALEASERARAESGRILETAKSSPQELASFLSRSSLSDLTFRFALLYALQEAGLLIAESPTRTLGLAAAALDRLEREREGDPATPPERVVPLKAIAAQSHLLAGQARNWTGELEQAREHLEKAYRAFGESTGDDLSLAIVELSESQRRAFAGDPAAGFLLAKRARATFEELELEDYVARGRVAEGISLSKIEGREDEALEAFRSALPVFHERELWSNYMGALSNLAACLSSMGRLDEARREYARALKSVSRERHAAWVGYIRNGLALVLLRAENYGGAALAFLQAAQLFREVGNLGNALTADLYEVECWALSGNLERAAQRFEIFRSEVARYDALDSAILRQLAAALSGSDPNLEEVSLLRESAGQQLRARFTVAPRAPLDLRPSG
jgi:tetratricopeptide (TPR) repeat protein